MIKRGNRLSDRSFDYALFLSDMAALTVALLFSYFLRDQIRMKYFPPLIQPLWIYLRTLPFLALVWFILFYQFGLYRLWRSMSRLTELVNIFKAVSLSILFAMAASFLTKFDYSRVMLIFFWANGLIAVIAFRGLMVFLLKRFSSRKNWKRRVIIYGTGEMGKFVLHKIKKYPAFGYEVAGFVDDPERIEGLRDVSGYPVLGPVDRIIELADKQAVDEVLIARPQLHHKNILSLASDLQLHGLRTKMVSDSFGIFFSKINLDALADLPVVEFRGRKMGGIELLIKQVLDYAMALALIMITLPFFLIISLLVKLTSHGPVIFSQKRVGKDGRIFRILKFRTMYRKVPKYEISPSSNDDARITPLGRILRKIRFDELPQLFNVLKGDMSMVGPRPEMSFITKQYQGWEKRRLEVKPGITGLWQVDARKGQQLKDTLEWDFYYIQNQSLLLDFTILLRTIPIILSGRGT